MDRSVRFLLIRPAELGQIQLFLMYWKTFTVVIRTAYTNFRVADKSLYNAVFQETPLIVNRLLDNEVYCIVINYTAASARGIAGRGAIQPASLVPPPYSRPVFARRWLKNHLVVKISHKIY
jgi:hypothetical protein